MVLYLTSARLKTLVFKQPFTTQVKYVSVSVVQVPDSVIQACQTQSNFRCAMTHFPPYATFKHLGMPVQVLNAAPKVICGSERGDVRGRQERRGSMISPYLWHLQAPQRWWGSLLLSLRLTLAHSRGRAPPLPRSHGLWRWTRPPAKNSGFPWYSRSWWIVTWFLKWYFPFDDTLLLQEYNFHSDEQKNSKNAR